MALISRGQEGVVRMKTLRRIGMLTPSSNTVVEPVTQAVCHPVAHTVSTHFTRFHVTQISLDKESLDQFGVETMLTTARMLAEAPLDAVIWNGTSGAWLGVEVDRSLCNAIKRETGTPASTSVLAQLEAMEQFGVRRYALATPYMSQVNERIIQTFADLGFECVHHVALGISVNREFNEVPLDRVREHVMTAARPGAQSILVLCTNFPAAYVVEQIEADLGLPVIDSTLAGIWKGLRMVGITTPLPGWGRLLRDGVPGPQQAGGAG